MLRNSSHIFIRSLIELMRDNNKIMGREIGVQQGGGNILYNTLKSKQNPLDREEKGRKTEGLKRKRLKN